MSAKWDRTKGSPEPISALNRILELENGEPLVYMPDVCPSVRIHRPQVIPYLRKSVCEMLERAAQTLPTGFYLSAIDAWRPFDRQRRIYESMTNFAREAFPHLDHSQMRRKVNRWVAPVDQKAPPGHCTGAAVDVFLVDEAKEVIDVWSPFTRFSAAPTFTYGLNADSGAARTLLVEAMLGAGFSNCRDEWWHYSYGDAGWAVRMGHTSCVYGLVTLPEASYVEQEALWIEANKLRTNPFLEG